MGRAAKTDWQRRTEYAETSPGAGGADVQRGKEAGVKMPSALSKNFAPAEEAKPSTNESEGDSGNCESLPTDSFAPAMSLNQAQEFFTESVVRSLEAETYTLQDLVEIFETSEEWVQDNFPTLQRGETVVSRVIVAEKIRSMLNS
jgi:hypothetical protein